jgi:hypothetical protein
MSKFIVKGNKIYDTTTDYFIFISVIPAKSVGDLDYILMIYLNRVNALAGTKLNKLKIKLITKMSADELLTLLFTNLKQTTESNWLLASLIKLVQNE